MAMQTVFKRYELKYMLTPAQKEKILGAMQPYMELDQYGRTTIRNIYYDTDSYRLIRRSIEKPAYKEKLRVRSYSRANVRSTVFVELKKKYKNIVYKRRLALSQLEATEWLSGNCSCPRNTQIAKEIEYFMEYYETLRPAVFLSYDREAFFSKNGSDFRITFDNTILCRQSDLSLGSEVSGVSILEPDKVLMEIKCAGGIPIWLTRLLSEQQLYKTSYSKYAAAYQTMIFPGLKEAVNFA